MNTNFTKRLCSQIRILRKNYGLTQEQLAERLGVSYQAVSKWENGQSCPDIALVPLIRKFLVYQLMNFWEENGFGKLVLRFDS
ncbi:helix-turn-helix transcriptional regulator [Paenibacillus filicis]|uniref:Helix-turn-helix transcriptional regulator n=1 Tax=Paenibacillus filicis TaxID=669464 RepID=A0ABU9DTE1_9BACL